MASGSGLSGLSSDLCFGLNDLRTSREGTGDYFLPIERFTEFAGRDLITQALQKDGSSEAEAVALASHILDPPADRQAIKLCLILLAMEQTASLKDLRKYGITDSGLPWTLKDLRKREFVDRNGSLVPPGFFSAWPVTKLMAFPDYQPQFLAPKLESHKFVYDMHPRVPLPIIRTNQSLGTNFSTVTKVQIPPSHFSGINPGDEGYFALKEVKLSGEMFSESAQKNELKNLELIRRLSHTHIINPTAVFKMTDNTLAFLFPWFKNGTLEDLWQRENLAAPFPKEMEARKTWMMQQMTYITSALSLLAENKCRHGDLKPANLLCSVHGSEAALIITDVGIAKIHAEATEIRQTGTDTKASSHRYMPPEFVVQKKSPTQQQQQQTFQTRQSRRYDVWSLGCILVEFMIWVQSGHVGYQDFARKTKDIQAPFHNGRTIHPRVTAKIDALKSAGLLHEVLDYIEQHMLVPKDDRHTAEQVLGNFKGMCGRVGIRLDSESSRAPAEESGETSQLSPPMSTPKSPKSPKPPPPPARPIVRAVGDSITAGSGLDTDMAAEQIETIPDWWTVAPDNITARNIPARENYPPADGNLCEVCSDLALWQADFAFSRQVGELEISAWSCQLCNVLSATARELNLTTSENLQLNWQDSNLHASGPSNARFANLAVFLDPLTPDLETPIKDHESTTFSDLLQSAQIGHPTLPPSNSPDQYNLLQHLLSLCNETHKTCKKTMSTQHPTQMPTRLIFIGDSDSELRLETSPPSKEHYAALSHRWGGNIDFRTLKDDLTELEKSILFGRLQKNFQHAVWVTRALGLSYLWIDTLCIVQDDKKDLEDEAAKMDDVFGNAYFTIAVSSEASSEQGFLTRHRQQPLFATLRGPESVKLHVSQSLENFHRDVETAPLSTRGWVYQERALARRTLHFTETQVYWECSDGVSSERLFKLTNRHAALLGDSNFPRAMLGYQKGGRQEHFQIIYKQYSALQLSIIKDRSRAILGLEKRLKNTLKTQGAFGILQVYFQRSLLWQRQPPNHLKRIKYPDGEEVPSWSWMAYEGTIDYMKIPAGGVDWSFESDKLFDTDTDPEPDVEPVPPKTSMKVIAKKLIPDQLEYGDRIKYDEAGSLSEGDLRCVVLGISKEADENGERTHYALVIAEHPDRDGSWRRVGAAWLLERHLGPAEEEVLLR